jgi:hypothetical protein
MIIPMPGKIQYQRSDTVITITLDTIRFQGTLKNGLFAQSPRCSKKFYPRNISHMPAVKFHSRLDLERKFSFFKDPFSLLWP